MSRLDPHKDEIVASYQSGSTTAQLGARFGCHAESIRAFLSRHGIDRRQGKPRVHDYAAVLREWNDCRNQHVVSDRLGVSQTHVCRILNEHGIRVGRGFREPVIPLPIEEMTSRYLAGENCREIANTLGVDPEVVRMRMKKHGIDRRSRGHYEPRGQQNLQWKGGRESPMHYHRRQSYEVVAICLGRPLPKGWVIHHLDEDATNNSPSNLVLFESQRIHSRYHQQLLRRQLEATSKEAILLALEIGGRPLPLPPAPIEFGLEIDLPSLSDIRELLGSDLPGYPQCSAD